jgi:predicted metal-dependent phosphoesterase TrpH
MQAPPRERAFVDLHSHSRFSFDSVAPLHRMMAVAQRRGLTHLAITDHDRIDGALRARDTAPPGLKVIVGEEIRTADGDVVGLYLSEAVAPGMSALETVDAIHAQGGLAGIPHPFDRFRSSGLRETGPGWIDELVDRVDYIEAFNARVPYPAANEKAAEFARERGLPGVASSDAHSLVEVGVAYTLLNGPLDTAEQMKAALAEVQLVMQRASYAVRLWTPVAKFVQRVRGNRRVAPVSAVAPAIAPPGLVGPRVGPPRLGETAGAAPLEERAPGVSGDVEAAVARAEEQEREEGRGPGEPPA